MTKKLLALVVLAGGLSLGVAGQASAEPAHPGCRGLNNAHEQVHDTPIPGEDRLHHLRGHGAEAWRHHCS